MIAGQQPLEQILAAISAMISHQDGSLRCVTMRLENQRLEMSQQGQNEAPGLCQALRDASGEAAEIWPLTGFHVSHMAIAELENRPGAAAVAREARRMGFESCWSVPVISSSQFPMGLLLVFSPRLEKPADPERQLIEASGRTAAIAIEHRYLSDLLAFQAAHDSLTGLANRSSFEDCLRKAIARAESCGEQLAVLYVDLDRFKEVNDRFGHSTGDELLRQVAARLRKCTRHSDVLARFGGDEFTMLLQGLREKAESKRVAGAVLDAFQTPFQLENNLSLRVTASIGISIYPRDGADAATLESNSDIAMYRVKASGRNNFHSYDGDGSPKPELVA